MKQPVPRAGLETVVAEAFAGAVGLRDARELTEGTFNSAHLLTLTDGRRAVLKVAPPPATPVLTYEHGLAATEAMCLRLIAGRTSVPAPRLLAAGLGTTSIGREWLLTTVVPGASWSSQAAEIGPAERARLRRQLGGHIAALHTVTGDGPFGYPAPGSPLTGPTWGAAYRRIIDALLDDAARHGVELPRPGGALRERLHAASAVLDVVTRPVLVHFDLWDGNVFVDRAGGEPFVSGLIDHERALWGDPAVDLVSPALFGDIADDEDFLTGYAEAGGPVVLDEATRGRLHLYRVHLALVMLVETGPRGSGSPGYVQRLHGWLLDELAAAPT